jgi:hypothetical protein
MGVGVILTRPVVAMLRCRGMRRQAIEPDLVIVEQPVIVVVVVEGP